MGRPEAERNDEDVRFIVILAKLGDENAKLDLFERFRWFLLKYRALLKTGIFNSWNGSHGRDVRAFLSLYSESRHIRAALLSRKGVPQALPKMMAAVNKLVSQLRYQCNTLGDDEIDSIINMTFFQCLSVYDAKRKVKVACAEMGLDYDTLPVGKQVEWDEKVPEVGFEGFLYNYYHYLLRKNLDTMLKGVMAGLGWCASIDQTHGQDDPTDEEGLSSVVEPSEDIDSLIAEAITIDEKWISGDTATWPWSELTTQERWLIAQRFYHRRFACDIAEAVGVSPSVIRNRIKIIRQRVADIFTEQGEIMHTGMVLAEDDDQPAPAKQAIQDDEYDGVDKSGPIRTRKMTPEELEARRS